jgi:DNA-directed RNA polymerase subunit RPC12/RpoP
MSDYSADVHNGWPKCPTCGRRFRVRWWRRLGHRLSYPIFGVIYIARITEWLNGVFSTPDREEFLRRDFWIECPSCETRVVLRYGR